MSGKLVPRNVLTLGRNETSVLPMTTTAALMARKSNLFAKTATNILVQSLMALDAKNFATLTDAESQARMWLIDEIEARVGGIQDWDAFDDLLEAGLNYVEAMLVMFPALAA